MMNERGNILMRGRPKEKNPRSFILPSIRLKGDEVFMFKIKAAIAANGNMSLFIRKAVQAYKPQLPEEGGSCFECGGTLKRSTYDTGLEDIGSVIKNIPAYKCENCGSVEMDLAVEAAIGEFLESFKQKGIPIPKEINVNDYV
jgi:YgiT-type zinc finger domain-containing protein